ncbi:hypothetical protein HAX54_009927 [Datura stramonium]|uniref:Uncharacterized protein n=1 Tax=Datura stramonium TaxID=4076 RepID=A0ABS8TGC0_DATST|nr:hypothetical protein [Datura stramonium]
MLMLTRSSVLQLQTYLKPNCLSPNLDFSSNSMILRPIKVKNMHNVCMLYTSTRSWFLLWLEWIYLLNFYFIPQLAIYEPLMNCMYVVGSVSAK